MVARRLARSLFVVASLAFAVVGAPSCGGGTTAQTDKFVGPWTFATGQLTPNCLGSPLAPFDLTGLNVTFTKVDGSTISLMANTGCNVKFTVSGGLATAAANQTCTLDLGGTFGPQSITIVKWTLSLTGDSIKSELDGKASICVASGTATLVRGTTAPAGSDGGARDGAADGHDAAATDAGVDVGAVPDAAVSSDADASADTD